LCSSDDHIEKENNIDCVRVDKEPLHEESGGIETELPKIFVLTLLEMSCRFHAPAAFSQRKYYPISICRRLYWLRGGYEIWEKGKLASVSAGNRNRIPKCLKL
jgi:hypothetical protein